MQISSSQDNLRTGNMKCWEIDGYNGKAGLHFHFLSDSFLELTT